MMGVVAGIAAAVFGVFWTIGAMSMGAPPFLGLFGVVFVVLAIVGVGYNLFNATSRDRMSTLDITSGNEEVDPIAQALGHVDQGPTEHTGERDDPRKYPGGYCPFCGAEVKEEFQYCPSCGRDI